MRNTLRTMLGAILLVLGGLAAGCREDPDLDEAILVFSGEANRLNAYAPDAGDAKQTVVERRSSDPDGWDMNGQICFDPDGSRRFIAGEDTNQPDPPPGWGFFQLNGTEIGQLSATRIGKLTPTYQETEDGAENFGCGFLSNGTLVTTDVGNQAEGPANGQLILWFPPFDRFAVPYCKLDIEIGTAGGIYVDERDRVYVASARVTSGVYRYSGPLPTSNTAAGGCGRTDPTGAPLADSVQKELFIPADVDVPTPSGVARAPHGGFYVTSVFNGVIAEFDLAGNFVRRILQPPSGEVLGSQPYSTGSPFGIGVDSTGTIYYADIGIVIRGASIGPGPSTGTVRRIRFVDGDPQPPETMDSGLDFPDGIGVLE